MFFLSLVFLEAITLNSARKIPITFSSTDMNRLALKNGRIKQIFGVDLFQIEKDEETGQIFLSMKDDMTAPNVLSMAFVTDNGITQDLLVTFKEGKSESVIFETEQEKKNLVNDLKHFCYNIVTNKTNLYTRVNKGEDKILTWGKAEFQNSFLSEQFTARIFNLIGNQKSCLYKLSHRAFIEPGVCAVYLSDTTASNKNSVTLIQIRQRMVR